MTNDLEHSVGLAAELAKQGALGLVELIEMADTLVKAGQSDQSIILYRLWIESTESPLAFVAYFNLGGALSTSGDISGAEQAYRQAISLNPNFAQARLNLGLLLERRGQLHEALEQWRLVLNFPVSVEKSLNLFALNNLGRLLEIMHQFSEAEGMLQRSLMIEPTQANVVQHWVHLRQKQCKWPIYTELDGLSVADMVKASSPLAMLASSDDPALQLSASRRFVAEKVNTQADALCNPQGYGHKKLRIGYLSSNFCIHAVSILTVELFDLHDRSRVEIYGFCWSNEDKTYMLARIAKAMDHYIRIADMSDEEAAQCIRLHEIDILVDLQGITSGARPNILSFRPAPVQIAYLGYPGTTGNPSIDYVLADKFVLPEQLAPYFTEKPLYMPHSFQISDRARLVGQCPTRIACGLPEAVFVFCSFNNNFKFTPEVFATWMRILARVPDSVLWLLADNEWARENLCQAAEQVGVNRERLIFVPRVSPPDYLARYQVADLFLDTCPFNAGTTANDALWMGLPLLTCSGRTFASRMAGSLLTALGLPELITTDLQAYEEKAVELANNKEKIAWLKSYLNENRKTSRLFDIPTFVKDLEDLYARVSVRGYIGGETLKDIPGAALATIRSSNDRKEIAAETSPTVMGGKHVPPTHAKNGEKKVRLYQITYSEESLLEVERGYLVLDSQANERPDWQAYWPIRKYLLTADFDEDTFYGFFSPGFREKTLLSFGEAISFINAVDPCTDVITFSYQPDIGAFFKNVFESKAIIENCHMKVSQKFLDSIGYEVDLNKLIMDSRTIVFSNYFAAKPRFWRAWFEITEKLFAIAEGKGCHSELQVELVLPTAHHGAIERKVFLIESIASLLLSTQKQWKTVACNPFKMAWSTQLGHAWKEAILSDALKIAFNEQGHHEYIGVYNIIRDSVFRGK